MAYIESHQEVDDHPKTRKAARLLGIGIPQMIGHLHIFWHWALDYAPSGDVTGYPAEDLADGARWEGDAKQFVQALIDCRISGDKAGYLECTEDGRVLLHDWHEYGGKLLAKRQADAARKRAGRAADKTGISDGGPLPIQWTSNGHPTDGAGRVEESRREESREESTTTGTAQPFAAETLAGFTAIATKKIEGICGFLSSADTADQIKVITKELFERGVTCWLDQALAEAEGMNKRNWKYVKAILERCLREGTPPGAKPEQADDWQPQGYRKNGNGRKPPDGLTPGLRVAARRLKELQENGEAD